MRVCVCVGVFLMKYVYDWCSISLKKRANRMYAVLPWKRALRNTKSITAKHVYL